MSSISGNKLEDRYQLVISESLDIQRSGFRGFTDVYLARLEPSFLHWEMLSKARSGKRVRPETVR